MSGGAIIFEACRTCGHDWVLPRTRCPHCGSLDIGERTASGRGRVYSATLVHRASDPTLRPFLPYRIGLVDLEEGPRLMAWLEGDAPIGARVEGSMQTFGNGTIPVFRQVNDDNERRE